MYFLTDEALGGKNGNFGQSRGMYIFKTRVNLAKIMLYSLTASLETQINLLDDLQDFLVLSTSVENNTK